MTSTRGGFDELARDPGSPIASMISIALGIAALAAGYTIGSFAQPLNDAFGWSREQVLRVPLIITLGVLPMTFVVGWIADRFGVRRLVILSEIGLGLVFIALGALTNDLTTFYLLYFLMAFAAAGTLPITFSKLLTARFTQNRGLAIGIALSGTGVCGFFAPAYTTWAIGEFGWRGAYYALAALPLGIALPTTLWLLRDVPLTERRVNRATSDAGGTTLGRAVQQWRFWAIGVAFLLGSAAVTGFIGSIVPMLTDKHYTPQVAATTAAAFGAAVIVGRLIVGYLVDRIWGGYVGGAFLFPAALAALYLALGQGGGAGTLIAIAVVGLATGAEFDLGAYLCSRYFGRKNFGTIYAAHYFMFAIGGGSAAPFYGRAFDLTGSYAPALVGSAAAFVIASILLLSLGRYPLWDEGSNA